MEPLVMIAPLSIALCIVHESWQGEGWYDWTGLWRQFQRPECQYEVKRESTRLRAAADPFVPDRAQKGQGLSQNNPTEGSGFLHATDWRQLRVASRYHLERAAG